MLNNPDDLRICQECRQPKELTEYYTTSKTCKPCISEANKAKRLQARNKQASTTILNSLGKHLKRCRDCEQEKPITAFYQRSGAPAPDNCSLSCKECCRQKDRARKQQKQLERTECLLQSTWDERIRQKTEHIYSSRLRYHYGITLEQYQEQLKIQDQCCAICGKRGESGTAGPDGLVVDHDHQTGKVRGLLCPSCNRGLGCFQDERETLRKAAEYLRLHASWEEKETNHVQAL